MSGFNPHAAPFLPSTPSPCTVELRVRGEDLSATRIVQQVDEVIDVQFPDVNLSFIMVLQVQPDPSQSEVLALFVASSYVLAAQAVAIFNSSPSPFPWTVQARLAPENDPPVPYYYPYPFPFPMFYPPAETTVKPVPSFITNLVARNKRPAIVPSTQLITIADENGKESQVNPCRLFVGNVPFLSTWSALKGFLVSTISQFEPHASLNIIRVEIPMQTATDETGHRSSSRGFAIVTTSNEDTSAKLIEHANEEVFEGRKLTVRYDQFPDFNNYVVQQLYPNKLHRSVTTLGSLGYERKSLHQRLYYDPPNTFQNQNITAGLPFKSSVSSKQKPVPSAANVPATKIRAKNKRVRPQPEDVHDDVDEGQRARELVDSFRSLGLN